MVGNDHEFGSKLIDNIDDHHSYVTKQSSNGNSAGEDVLQRHAHVLSQIPNQNPIIRIPSTNSRESRDDAYKGQSEHQSKT